MRAQFRKLRRIKIILIFSLIVRFTQNYLLIGIAHDSDVVRSASNLQRKIRKNSVSMPRNTSNYARNNLVTTKLENKHCLRRIKKRTIFIGVFFFFFFVKLKLSRFLI